MRLESRVHVRLIGARLGGRARDHAVRPRCALALAGAATATPATAATVASSALLAVLRWLIGLAGALALISVVALGRLGAGGIKFRVHVLGCFGLRLECGRTGFSILA